MTETRQKAFAEYCKLQWGHGAWPWMTATAETSLPTVKEAPMGPRRMAVDDHNDWALEIRA